MSYPILAQTQAQTPEFHISVSWDDILSFHTRHFPHSAKPYNHAVEEAPTEEEETLGFYGDGRERTLTDEQIAMFRHSELQEMIKEHRIWMENKDDDSDLPDLPDEPTKPTIRKEMDAATHNEEEVVKATRQVLSKSLQPSNKSSTIKNQHKRGKKRFYKPEKQDKGQFTHDGDERTFRRICREADELQNQEVELDY